MQEKIAKVLLLGVVLFFLSVEFAEVINFIYIVPFCMPFLLFVSSAESELHQERLYFSFPFIFGLISDILTMNGIFVLCVVFPLVSYCIFYIVENLKIPKPPVFLAINLIFALVQCLLGSPVWVGIVVACGGFLSWKIFSWICSKLLAKENG